ncbi:MAG: hypothetical protein WD669_08490 [Pirellulales bacterium]
MFKHSPASLRIILLLVAAAGCRPWTPQHVAPTAPPVLVQEYPVTGVSPSPMIVDQGSGPAPVFPPHSTVVPLPSHTPGSIFGPPVGSPAMPAAPAGPLADIAPGGLVSPQFGLPPGPEGLPLVASSISVPVTNDEWAWDQITDVVGDYFTITAEQPARRGGEVLLEGRIDTAPQDGATWLEPQRNDSVGRFNRWESTFQTIRRRAAIRVIPLGPNYTIEIAVEKELEDLPHPERATAGAATFRNDGSLPTEREEQVSRTRTSPRWISLGRDPPLEQRMLSEIHARLTGAATGAAPIFGP